jgi:hypothetical protein
VADEVDPPVLAPKFAVGDDPQADALLQRNDVGDRLVLDSPKRGGVDLARLASAARVMNAVGTQETADDVGARLLSRLGHVRLLSSQRARSFLRWSAGHSGERLRAWLRSMPEFRSDRQPRNSAGVAIVAPQIGDEQGAL